MFDHPGGFLNDSKSIAILYVMFLLQDLLVTINSVLERPPHFGTSKDDYDYYYMCSLRVCPFLPVTGPVNKQLTIFEQGLQPNHHHPLLLVIG